MVSLAMYLWVSVCVRCPHGLQMVRFKRKSHKEEEFSLKSILIGPSHVLSLKSILSLIQVLSNRSRYCIRTHPTHSSIAVWVVGLPKRQLQRTNSFFLCACLRYSSCPAYECVIHRTAARLRWSIVDSTVAVFHSGVVCEPPTLCTNK